MLESGDRAPAFSLPAQNGEKVKLSDLKGQTVVLYFYPKANTSGCTTQACGVRDRKADYAATGARVVGISPDEVKDIDNLGKIARVFPKVQPKKHDDLVLAALKRL